MQPVSLTGSLMRWECLRAPSSGAVLDIWRLESRVCTDSSPAAIHLEA